MSIFESVSKPVRNCPDENAGPARALSLETDVEDSVALVRAAVLLARNFGSTLQLSLPEWSPAEDASWRGNQRIEIHFGAARCEALLSSLLEVVRERLGEVAAAGPQEFVVEVFLLPSAPVVIDIRRAETRQLGGSQVGRLAWNGAPAPQKATRK